VIPGGPGIWELRQDGILMDWISQVLPKARRVASVCLGAFVLAWTGVLDGKRAVTHWRYCPRLADGFSRISVEPNAIFVKDGRVWTSAGVSAGIDLALAMIEEDFGHITALDVARRLVVFLKRPGGQSQFSTCLPRRPRTWRGVSVHCMPGSSKILLVISKSRRSPGKLE